MDIIALSSGESELGALVRGCTEGLGVRSLLEDFDIPVQIKVLSDSTAAIGMVRRLGLGRVRRLGTADLWIQQGIRKGSFSVTKYPTADNCADLMTKVKSRSDLYHLLQLMGFAQVAGRSEIAPKRFKLWDVSKIVASPKDQLPQPTPT